VRAPRQQPQHPPRIVVVVGLGENFAGGDDGRVRGQDDQRRAVVRRAQPGCGLLAREAEHVLFRRLARCHTLVDVGRAHVELVARQARRRSEDQMHGGMIS
jgi:hypothetical protein